ncbi:MAG: VanZ family protein [Desulfobacterales bacterium]|nr:VanZ family protein [Desulfobacterales bacterium]
MTKKYKVFLFYWLPLLVFCFLIYFQSSHPAPGSIPHIPHIDKLLHFAAYFILGILFFRAFITLPIRNRIHLLILFGILSSSLYGLSDEIHQYYVPSRDADLLDLSADILGSICGVYFYYLTVLKKRQTEFKIPESKKIENLIEANKSSGAIPQ